MTTRVVVADDHPLMRSGIVNRLNREPGIEVVAEVGTGDEVVAVVEREQPDVLLLDFEMPGARGDEVALRLRQREARTRILVLTAHDCPSIVSSMLARGVDGFLLKDEAPELIVDAVRSVGLRRTTWLSRRISCRLAKGGDKVDPTARPITARQREVLSLLALGKTNAEIGSALLISVKTVEKHLGALYSRLGVGSRVEAVVVARRRDLI